MTLKEKQLLALNEIRFNSDAGDNLTVKEYFLELLSTLWYEGEGFSGKRPFGNSCWEYDLFNPLVYHGILEGKVVDEEDDGYYSVELTRKQREEAFNFIESLIPLAFGFDE